jgi:hypothetical protein
VDVVDAAAWDRWVLGPEVAQVHPDLFPFMLDWPERAEPRRLARTAQLLVVLPSYHKREVGLMLEQI